MPRIRSLHPRLTSAGYLTSRAMVRNLEELADSHIRPCLDSLARTAWVLDVGCGHRPYRGLLTRSRIVGINLDRTDAAPDVVGDGMRLPFKPGHFDTALCTQVVEHVRDPGRLLREIATALKPDGLLLLSGPMHWPLHEEPHDYWRFTRHGLRLLLEENGFSLLELREDGFAISLAVMAINHLFPGPHFAPLRAGLNSLGLLAESLFRIRHSTPNHTLVAKRVS